jgi:hypothetical protein
MRCLIGVLLLGVVIHVEAPSTSATDSSSSMERIKSSKSIVPVDSAELLQILNHVVAMQRETAKIERQELLSVTQQQVQRLTESLQAFQRKQESMSEHMLSLAERCVGMQDTLTSLILTTSKVASITDSKEVSSRTSWY